MEEQYPDYSVVGPYRLDYQIPSTDEEFMAISRFRKSVVQKRAIGIALLVVLMVIVATVSKAQGTANMKIVLTEILLGAALIASIVSIVNTLNRVYLIAETTIIDRTVGISPAKSMQRRNYFVTLISPKQKYLVRDFRIDAFEFGRCEIGNAMYVLKSQDHYWGIVR